MVDLLRQGEMTDASSVSRASLVKTVVGMAHFAGSGPEGRRCLECIHWTIFGRRKTPGCQKYWRMTGDAGKAVPGSTPACRHFEGKQK